MHHNLSLIMMQGLVSAPFPPSPPDVSSKCSLLSPLFNGNHKKGVRNYNLIVQKKRDEFSRGAFVGKNAQVEK